MTKLGTLATVVVLALVGAACGDSSNATTETDAGTDTGDQQPTTEPGATEGADELVCIVTDPLRDVTTGPTSFVGYVDDHEISIDVVTATSQEDAVELTISVDGEPQSQTVLPASLASEFPATPTVGATFALHDGHSAVLWGLADEGFIPRVQRDGVLYVPGTLESTSVGLTLWVAAVPEELGNVPTEGETSRTPTDGEPGVADCVEMAMGAGQ